MVNRIQLKDIFWLICLLFPLTQLSGSKHYRFLQLDTRNGLSNNFVSCIFQDKQGYMWFGTREGGINRFDGNEFEVFYHQTESDGLTHNYITGIIEDKTGVLWIGTMGGGINYFDPKSGKLDNLNSRLNIFSYLPSKIIHSLFIDSGDNLWIGSTAGLTKYSFEAESYKMYPGNSGESPSITKVLSIIEYEAGHLLIGTDQGLWHFDISAEKFYLLLPEKEVRAMKVDHSGAIWVGTTTGLFRADNCPLIDFRNQVRMVPGFSGDIVNALTVDVNNLVWVGTDNKGIILIDSDGKTIENFLPDPDIPFSLSDHSINSLYIDQNNTVWVGTNSGGVNAYSLYNKPFTSLGWYKLSKMGSIYINRTFVDSKDRLWIATREGIYLWKKNSDAGRLLNVPGSNNVLCVSELPDGRIIIGTFGAGIFFFDEDRQEFKKSGIASLSELSELKVWDILPVDTENTWIGTIGNGAFHINEKSRSVTHYAHDSQNEYTLANNFIKQIVADHKGNIWFLTNHQGVSRLGKGQTEMKNFLYDSENKNSLMDNSVDDIYCDPEGKLYFSTYAGLCTFNHELEEFIPVLPGNDERSLGAKGVRVDQNGNLWILTNNSLIRFSPEENDIWEIRDIGYHFGEFKRSSIYSFKDGTMVITGTNETILFDPGEIKKNPVPPRLALTNLYVNYETVTEYSDNSVLKMPLNLTNTIQLSHNQRVFSIEFTDLNFLSGIGTQFYYMLEGYDKIWVNAGMDKRASYTNLDPGQYQFTLRGVNNDGVETFEERVLNVVVHPPWWKTLVFRFSVLLVLASLILFFYRYRIASLKRRQIYLEGLIESKTRELHSANEELLRQQGELIESQNRLVNKKEQLEKVNEMLLERNLEIQEINEELKTQKVRLEELSLAKSRFFANISHEFRTPLTLIMGPLEKLAGRLRNEAEYFTYTGLIERNSKRLLELINQLLDIAKLEAGKAVLKVSRQDISNFTKTIFNSFLLRAEKQGLTYIYSGPEETREVFFDPDIVQKILFNLISNAFKFTPRLGRVEVRISIDELKGKRYLEMEVIDSGVGMTQERLEKAFEYFTQAGNTDSGIPGSGIGLALVKQVAILHKGDVEIQSKPGQGTAVKVWIRTDEPAFLKEEIIDTPAKFESLHAETESITSFDQTDLAPEISNQYLISENAPYVLVIEDNTDVLLFIKDILKSRYNILTATHGENGYETATRMVPDLIICDVMLPDSNGIEICKRIKANELTNHIPVIILTALGSEDHMLAGLESGVDNYLTKPFNPSLLELRVKNLISTRANLIERYKINFLSTELQVLRSKSNEQFVSRLIQMIEENIEDPGFSNDNIAQELNVSTRQLYRKLDGVINMPLNKFIRHVKMKKAREIMQTVPDLNISEVAYKVGFNDPKYFSKCFREEFGSLPSEFLK